MSTNKDPIFLNSVVTKNKQIDNADGTTGFIVFTAGADGGAVTRLSATTTDTSAVIVKLTISDGTDSVDVGEVTVPAGSGTDGSTPTKNLLDAVALAGLLQADGSLIMGPSATLTVAAKAAVTAAKVLDITAQGGQYNV